ncbi:hypothetical protein KHA80_15060 [Anaerobacillus sp. HL2]|nr:hypothetical protein KHA80_15060 [Anaerobacillus sp. HL2]
MPSNDSEVTKKKQVTAQKCLPAFTLLVLLHSISLYKEGVISRSNYTSTKVSSSMKDNMPISINEKLANKKAKVSAIGKAIQTPFNKYMR